MSTILSASEILYKLNWFYCVCFLVWLEEKAVFRRCGEQPGGGQVKVADGSGPGRHRAVRNPQRWRHQSTHLGEDSRSVSKTIHQATDWMIKLPLVTHLADHVEISAYLSLCVLGPFEYNFCHYCHRHHYPTMLLLLLNWQFVMRFMPESRARVPGRF